MLLRNVTIVNIKIPKLLRLLMLTEINFLTEIAIFISLGLGLAALSFPSRSEVPQYSLVPVRVKPDRKP